jgi:hypothetical protein
MKKVWGLITLLSLGSAVMADVSDPDEAQFSKGRSSRPDDEAIKLISSPVLESVTQGDTPMRLDTGASPGADQRVLDPSFMEVKVVYPEAQPSWWECVYNYLFGD